MQVVNETTLLKTNKNTYKNAKFTKVVDQQVKFTRTLTSQDCCLRSNLLIRLRVRRQLIKNEYQVFICVIYGSHVHF